MKLACYTLLAFNLFSFYAHANSNPSSLPTVVNAGCNLGVVVPSDLHLCNGEDYYLCGDYDTSFPDTEFEWLANGDPTNYDLCDEIDIDETTTFTLSVTSVTDLIENGDFENGDDGSFTTAYGEGSVTCPNPGGFLVCEGTYGILNDPSDEHFLFFDCDDHTSGNGNMMVVNGASFLAEIWCQEVCVDPSSSYLFSAWATSVLTGSPAELQFSIDGTLIGSILNLTNNVCIWEEFEATWQASGQTNVEICVTNQNVATGGNDFALDDISFIQTCAESQEFTVTVSDMELDMSDPDEITCINDELELELEIYPFQPYDDIIWDTNDGDIIDEDGVFLTVGSAGTYEVTVTDIHACEFTYEVTVEEDRIFPTVTFDTINNLDCNNTSVTISSNTNASDPIYAWYDESGNLLGDDDDLTTDLGGTIELVVLDDNNGCEQSETIDILQDTLSPSFELQSSNDLTCNLSSAILNTNIPYPVVNWTNNIGIPIFDTNDTISITQAGEYYATVTALNGCTHIDTVIVTELLPSFSIQVTYEDHINCLLPISPVEINYDSALFQFSWTGAATSFGNVTTINIQNAGEYPYLLTDLNGCIYTSSISITEDFSMPNLQASTTQIECANPQATLTLPDPQNLYTINWTLPDGTTSSQQTVSTSQPGMAYYTISGSNGCSTLDSILVEASLDFPSVNISGEELNCIRSQVELVATASPDVTAYMWTLPDGTQATSQNISATETGIYQLVVTTNNNCSSTAQFDLGVDNIAPSLETLADLTLNCNQSIVEPVLTTNVIYETVSWSGPAFSYDLLDAVISEPGSYTLEVTAENGCSALQSFNVLIDTMTPEFSFTAPELLTCARSSFMTQVDIPLASQELSWTTPSGMTFTDQDILIDEAGTYLLTVIGSNGCSASSEYVVEKDTDFPQFNAEATALNCLANTTEISTESTNTTLDYIFFNDLTGDQLGTGDFLTIDGSTAIRIEATDTNGCTAIITIEIPLDTVPIDFQVTSDQLGCQVNGVVLDLMSNDPISSVAIYNEAGIYLGDESTFLESAETYLIEVAGANGCIQEETLDVTTDTTTLIFALATEILNCDKAGVPITIDINETYGSATLIDSNNEILEEVNAGSAFQEVSSAGIYTVVITNTNGCRSEQNIEVISDDDRIDFDLSAEILTCANTSTLIEIITNENYSESRVTQLGTGVTSSSIETFMIQMAGEYEVVLMGHNGCESYGIIEILEAKETPLIDHLTATTLSCDGQGIISDFSITGGAPPYTLSLDGGDYELIEEDYKIEGWGSHKIGLRDANGCQTDTSILLMPIEELTAFTIPEVTAFFGEENVLSLELNKPLSEIAQISWLPQTGLTCYDCLMPNFIAEEQTTYQINIVDLYGCETSVELRVLLEEIVIPPRVYIPNAFDLTTTNPNERFTIFSGREDIINIDFLSVYDRWGNKVFLNENFAANDLSEGWDGYYKGSKVISGVYVYHAVVLYRTGETEVLAGDITVLR